MSSASEENIRIIRLYLHIDSATVFGTNRALNLRIWNNEQKVGSIFLVLLWMFLTLIMFMCHELSVKGIISPK